MRNLEEKTLTIEKAFKGKILDVDIHTVQLPDGSQSKREIINHRGAVAVLAITKNNEIILVEQYRKAVEMVTLEIPAGKLEAGEDPLKSAVRELEEETGYRVGDSDLEKIFDVHVAIGYSSELITVYLAEDLEDVGEQNLDEDEFVNCKKYTLQEAFELLNNNTITDSKTMMALMWLQNKKGKK